MAKPKPKKGKNGKQIVPVDSDNGRVMLMEGRQVDIYEDDDNSVGKIVDVVRSVLGARKNRDVEGIGVYSDMRNRQGYFELGSIAMQNLFGATSIPAKVLGEIIGDKGAGKTTTALTLAGEMMSKSPNALLIFVQCGSKAYPSDDYVGRCLTTDKRVADSILKRVITVRALGLDEWFEIITTTVQAIRGVGSAKAKSNGGLPINQPIIMICDDWSMLASPTEASGIQTYGKFMEPESMDKRRKTEILGAGSNFEHAKFAHRTTRSLGSLLCNYNVTMIITRAQRADIDMSGGFTGGFKRNPIDVALENGNALGGSAFEDMASWRFVMARGYSMNSKVIAGFSTTCLFARMHSSYMGAHGRKVMFESPNQFLCDAGDYQTPALSGAKGLLMQAQLCGIIDASMDELSGNWTCPSLDQFSVSAERIMYELQHVRPEVAARIGGELKIHGYQKPNVVTLSIEPNPAG